MAEKLTTRIHRCLHGDTPGEHIDADEAAGLLEEARARIEELERLDREAATHVESVICMRTHFTGDPPYVGWKGIGLALTEVLDERDKMRSRIEELEGALRQANSRIEVLESFVDQASRIRFQMDKLSNEEALELRRQGDVTRVNEGDIICLQIAAAALNTKDQGNG